MAFLSPPRLRAKALAPTAPRADQIKAREVAHATERPPRPARRPGLELVEHGATLETPSEPPHWFVSPFPCRALGCFERALVLGQVKAAAAAHERGGASRPVGRSQP